MKKLHEKKGKDDIEKYQRPRGAIMVEIFGTQSKLPLGPADYEIKVDLTKQKTPALGFDSKSAARLPD